MSMSEITHKKSWWYRNWKWILPTTAILTFIFIFFIMTGDAIFRYGSVYVQPSLVNNAIEIAKENDLVIEKLGELSPHDFFRLLEGEVQYLDHNNGIAITVGIRSINGKKAKLDIIAYQNGQDWEYQKITIRIKKPIKETIKILER